MWISRPQSNNLQSDSSESKQLQSMMIALQSTSSSPGLLHKGDKFAHTRVQPKIEILCKHSPWHRAAGIKKMPINEDNRTTSAPIAWHDQQKAALLTAPPLALGASGTQLDVLVLVVLLSSLIGIFIPAALW